MVFPRCPWCDPAWPLPAPRWLVPHYIASLSFSLVWKVSCSAAPVWHSHRKWPTIPEYFVRSARTEPRCLDPTRNQFRVRSWGSGQTLRRRPDPCPLATGRRQVRLDPRGFCVTLMSICLDDLSPVSGLTREALIPYLPKTFHLSPSDGPSFLHRPRPATHTWLPYLFRKNSNVTLSD